MPKAIVKIQGAPNKTRWTLAQQEQALYSPKEIEVVTTMQANGGYYERNETPLPRYESYDGGQYGAAGLGRTASAGWKPPQVVNGHQEDYEYNTPLEERASHQISLNTRVRSQNHDVVGQHLLYETAMLDSQSFEMLDIAEVDALKKEHARLKARLEAANRKLALESKVRDAAQNLQRLYSVTGKGRPDTPQSPESPKRSRSSLLGGRGRTSSSGSANGQTLHQAEDEVAVSVKKVEELNATIKGLLERRQFVERKLLRHTAAVLAEQSARALAQQTSGEEHINGHVGGRQDEHTIDMYSPDEFDGIRDILHGTPGAAGKVGNTLRMQEEHQQQMTDVQSRIEHLNEQLRRVIGEASRTRGADVQPEAAYQDAEQEPAAQLARRLDRLEDNVHLLEQEQTGVKAHYARLQDSAHMTRNAVEEQLEGVNHHLHNTLLLGSDMLSIESLRDPPEVTGHGYQHQLQYLSDSLQSMEQLLRQQKVELEQAREASDSASRAIEDAHGKASGHAQKMVEYEATLGGLWEILQSEHSPGSQHPSGVDSADIEERGLPSPGTPLREDFSLPAFSSQVQHLFNRAQNAKEQHEILRRQVQQQRELNGKSDAEKDRQLTELQGKHDELAKTHEGLANAHQQLLGEHDKAQEELTKEMAQRAQAQDETAHSRLELMNTVNEFEGLKRVVETRQQERDDMQRQLQNTHSSTADLRQQIESLEAQVAELTDDARIFTLESDAKAKEAEEKHATVSEELIGAVAARQAAEEKHSGVQKELESLEAEVIRLTTELTMAKAELDGAYGSRAERAKEAQAADIAGLSERNKQMSDELQKLHGDHDGLRSLHDSLTGEHESLRSTHEATLAQIESLRAQSASNDRSKNLEAELHSMTDAFQDLTRESIELDKERGQLEDLIDGLRDRCEALEAQLNDERIRWMGIKSPTGAAEAQANGREMTSTMVIRQEFKKMMRETRAEGVKLLRVSTQPPDQVKNWHADKFQAEQEHRRQLEAELRRLRQANGPLAGTATPNGIGSHASNLPNGH
jgi:predicted  nucleic acid-binding Zn-ribbon protein